MQTSAAFAWRRVVAPLRRVARVMSSVAPAYYGYWISGGALAYGLSGDAVQYLLYTCTTCSTLSLPSVSLTSASLSPPVGQGLESWSMG